MITAAAILAIAANSTCSHVPTTACAVLELNHVYHLCSDGDRPEYKHQLSQMIGWDWYQSHEAMHVSWWRHWRSDDIPHRFRRGFAVEFFDENAGTHRRVEALEFRQTWTAYDPEVADREVLQVTNRRGL